MKKHITPVSHNIFLEDIKENSTLEQAYIPTQEIKKFSVLHSDIAFADSDGEIYLVEDNIKPDYNEWNW